MAVIRDHFSSRLGFILAASGSAIGLGNIWRFPHIAGDNGGGAFLLIYLALVFTIGLSVMLAEFTIGRSAERGPGGAFEKLKGGPWKYVGYLAVAAGFIILSYYAVVAGWTIAYVVKTVTGALSVTDPDVFGDAFGNFVSSPVQPIVYQAVFMALTMAVVYHGISRGIEWAAKILMPLLFLLLVVLAVRALTLPGSWEGVVFFLTPDFSRVDGGTFIAALGQAFFSLSIGMGALITYGSYLKRDADMPKSALQTVSLDTLVAVLAGLVILPAVFAFSFSPHGGPGLVFITLPAVFAQMPFGQFFGTLFFVLLVVAALTSAVSLLEVAVTYLVDEKGMKRSTVTLSIGGIIFLLGIPSSLSLGAWSGFTVLGMGILDALDFLASNIMLPVGGILISVFVGWVIFEKAHSEATSNGQVAFRAAPLWRFICRYLAPLAILAILINALL